MIKFSLVMPCFNNFDEVWFTVQTAWEMHRAYLHEIVVLDNNPKGVAANTLKGFINLTHGTRYVAYDDAQGTANAKNKAVEVATSEYVVCVDSHVILRHGALKALSDFFLAHPDCNDLVQGPLIYDNRESISTHFNEKWSGEMYGQWDTDDRVFSEKWFEIPAQGMGMFAVRKAAWPGFPVDYRGFGAEEHIIHGIFRKRGNTTYCVSDAQWIHKFSRVGGNPYAVRRYDKVRNYIIGFKLLGDEKQMKNCYDHFVTSGLMSQSEWEQAYSGKQDIEQKEPCTTCNAHVKTYSNLEDWYKEAHETPSDINEHCPVLRDLASKCAVVVDCGSRAHVNGAAFAAGNPGLLVMVDKVDSPYFGELNKHHKNVRYLQGTSLTADIPENDLLFLDTEPHNADHVMNELLRNREKCRRYIVLHDTKIFGENGQDNRPGILYAVREFVRLYPEWVVVDHHHNNHGLLILSRSQEDKKQPPHVGRKALSLVKALIRHGIDGGALVDETEQDKRHAICDMCKFRNDELCGECGCPIEKKIPMRSEHCPIGNW